MTGCSRYTVGAANAAPRVVSGAEGVVEDTEHAAEEATPTETVVGEQGATSSDEAAQATEETHADTAEHSTSIPELDNAMIVVRETFAHVRGSRAARHEAAEELETIRTALATVAETGAISHWESLNEHFEVATEKVLEGTNDAPNALNGLLEHLEEAAHH